jgi:excisionase family DNA binding protein
MTKEQAAVSLGVSMRTLQRMMSKNEIQFTQHRSERGGGAVAVFDEREVERVRKAREQAVLHPTHVRAEKKSVALERKPATMELNAFLASLKEWAAERTPAPRAAAPPLPDQVWLTKKQAAMLSGLSMRAVEQALASTELPAFKLGGRWRIKHDDLKVWVENFAL